MDIPRTGRPQAFFPSPLERQPAERKPASQPFVDTIKSFLKDTNDLQKQAADQIEALIAGETTDIHEVMIAAEKASVSFEMVMELRNKMLEAYQEMMRTQV